MYAETNQVVESNPFRSWAITPWTVVRREIFDESKKSNIDKATTIRVARNREKPGSSGSCCPSKPECASGSGSGLLMTSGNGSLTSGVGFVLEGNVVELDALQLSGSRNDRYECTDGVRSSFDRRGSRSSSLSRFRERVFRLLDRDIVTKSQIIAEVHRVRVSRWQSSCQVLRTTLLNARYIHNSITSSLRPRCSSCQSHGDASFIPD